MDYEELKSICLSTAKRCILRQAQYQVLNKSRLDESEVRNVMIKVLEGKKKYYGLEISTGVPFRNEFGKKTRSALFDLMLFGSKDPQSRSICIELKRGQPPLENIIKDFIKMIIEPAPIYGACFFHLLPRAEGRSEKALKTARNSVLIKYNKAYMRAIKGVGASGNHTRWFALFVLDSSTSSLYSHFEPNISNIKEFPGGEWERIQYRKANEQGHNIHI